jgi:polar amino acid transport system substrate-binding protein
MLYAGLGPAYTMKGAKRLSSKNDFKAFDFKDFDFKDFKDFKGKGTSTMPKSLSLLTIIIVTALSVSCSRGNGGGNNADLAIFTSLADFGGKRIGSECGSVFQQFIDRIIPNVDHRHYLTFNDIVAALRADAVDAIAIDMPVALHLAARDSALAVFPFVVSVDTYGFAVPKGSRLCEPGNEILNRFKENGVITDAEMYWFNTESDTDRVIPPLEHRWDFNGGGGTIRFGCEATLFPMSYTSSRGEIAGFDIDIVNRMAYELNMRVEVVSMPFGDLLPALLAGRLDMAGGSMTITKDREELVDFIGPYFEGGTALVVKKEKVVKN